MLRKIQKILQTIAVVAKTAVEIIKIWANSGRSSFKGCALA